MRDRDECAMRDGIEPNDLALTASAVVEPSIVPKTQEARCECAGAPRRKDAQCSRCRAVGT